MPSDDVCVPAECSARIIRGTSKNLLKKRPLASLRTAVRNKVAALKIPRRARVYAKQASLNVSAYFSGTFNGEASCQHPTHALS